jgi:hypothetical protein
MEGVGRGGGGAILQSVWRQRGLLDSTEREMGGGVVMEAARGIWMTRTG